MLDHGRMRLSGRVDSSFVGTYSSPTSVPIRFGRFDTAQPSPVTNVVGWRRQAGQSIGNIAAIAEDAFGELFIVDRGTGLNGEIYKITLSPAGAGEGSLRRGEGSSPGRGSPFTHDTSFGLIL
jgi:hypothetical protein